MNRPSITPAQDDLDQVVLKLHSRCDLACDHCYVYEAADQSWRGRPKVISDQVVSQAGLRMADYASAHSLPGLQIVLHGGEPLLVGHGRLRRVITELRQALGGVCRLDLRIHTNGVLLSERLCELFAEHGVKVGVSIDGDRAANDRHRRYADGRSSYDQVIRAIGLLRTERFRHLYAGLLCTIDVGNDPVGVYESLMDLEPPRIDFLLPHATWDHPPVRTPAAESEYADWLIPIFDRWVKDGRPARIRTFDSILSTLRGGESFTEALGLGPVSLVVIETDGSYEQVDSLKAAFEGAPDTGMNVFDHTMDEVARHPGIVARQQGIAGLCQTCQECPVVTSCGGGLYTHRHREGRGFANPSVYCPDLLKLISHIRCHLPVETTGDRGSPTHSLSDQDFRALAAGSGDAETVAALLGAQRSSLRAGLGALYQAAINAPAVSGTVRSDLQAAWALIAALDHDQPEALNATLSHPYLRAWAARCLERLGLATDGYGGEDQGRGHGELAADLGYLGAIAAAAATRAGAAAAIRVPIVNSGVCLPTLGRLALGAEEGTRAGGGPSETATVSVISNAVVIAIGKSCWTLDRNSLLAGAGGADAAPGTVRSGDWQPVRVLHAGGLRVALEDTDPNRDCHPWRAAPRVTGAGVSRWQRELQLAWHDIEDQPGGYALALAAWLTTLTPLAEVRDGREVSAACRQAFGAVAASWPTGPGTLALLLTREFQAAKLGAVLDLFTLYDQADDRFFPSPWGEGKHQLAGLLRSAYEHLAIAEFWRVRQRRAHGSAAVTAGRRADEQDAYTREAIATLLDSGSLTPLGERFVREMRNSATARTGPAGTGH